MFTPPRLLSLRSSSRPSPWRAGESHVDLRFMLRLPAIWILRGTPESHGGSDAGIHQDFPKFARPAGAERIARVARHPCYRAGSDAVRSKVRNRHGIVRAIQGNAAAAIPAVGTWHPQPR